MDKAQDQNQDPSSFNALSLQFFLKSGTKSICRHGMGYFHRLSCFFLWLSYLAIVFSCLPLVYLVVSCCVLLCRLVLSGLVLWLTFSCLAIVLDIESQMHILCWAVLFCLSLPGLVLLLNDSGDRVILSLCPGVPGFGTHIGVKDSLTADEEGAPSPHPQHFPMSRELSNTRVRSLLLVSLSSWPQRLCPSNQRRGRC